MTRLISAAGLCLLATMAFAKDLPRRQADEPRKEDAACDYLGGGYTKAPGSDTCIKVSGSMRAEGSVGFGR